MRKENQYMLCTVAELAKEFVARLDRRGGDISVTNGDRFTDCDFAVVDASDVIDSLEDTWTSAEGYYGIRRINTGFDSEPYHLDIAADYYGGGNLQMVQLSDEPVEWAEESLRKMIVKVLAPENAHEGTLLIVKESVIKKDGWILCEDMLPTVADDYYVTQYNPKAIDDYCDGYRTGTFFYDDNGWWDDIDAGCGWEIIAWQKLNKPYKPATPNIKRCPFDDGNGVCHATENDECLYDNGVFCNAKVDINGRDVSLPDGCYDV